MTIFSRLLLLVVFGAAYPPVIDGGQSGIEILNQAGISGGLVVHVGCGSGELTSQLHAGSQFTV